MSRVGNKPILIPKIVKIINKKQSITVTGPLGDFSLIIHKLIIIKHNKEKNLIVKRKSETKEAKSLHGLFRSLISNMIIGVTIGYKRELLIKGIGYKAVKIDDKLHLSLGFSHKIIFQIPKGINIKTNSAQNKIILESIDKQLIGETAAKIRSLRKPEPYKGKGIRYSNEVIKRKEGKSTNK
jgi:large subunit ribosomal protein L6